MLEELVAHAQLAQVGDVSCSLSIVSGPTLLSYAPMGVLLVYVTATGRVISRLYSHPLWRPTNVGGVAFRVASLSTSCVCDETSNVDKKRRPSTSTVGAPQLPEFRSYSIYIYIYIFDNAIYNII